MTEQLLHSVKTALNHFLVGAFAILPIYIVRQIFIWLATFVLQSVFDIREWVGHASKRELGTHSGTNPLILREV